MANIHTLSSTAEPAVETYEFKKSKKWKASMGFWIEVRTANEDIGTITPVPLDPTTKRPFSGILYSHDHELKKRWSLSKLNKFLKAKEHYKQKCDIGILFGGGIAVLDFDCEKHYNWFVNKFELDISKYIVVRNRGKHNCRCDTEEEYTYHLYFERDAMFDDKLNTIDCIYEENTKDLMKIDYLRDANNGTPHVAKCYAEGSHREVISCPTDKVIIPLNPLISHYMMGKWKQKAKHNGDRTAMKCIDLVNSIDKDIITGKNMEMICRELCGVGIDDNAIIDISLDIRNGCKYVNRIGDGPNEFTEEQHIDWIRGILLSNNGGGKGTYTIDTLAKKNVAYTGIQMKHLEHFGYKFSVSYLHDIKYYLHDEDERKRKLLAYYNHFFIITTGMSKNGVYLRTYDANGNVADIVLSSSLESFISFSGIHMVCEPNGKAKNSAKWWFDYKDRTYNKVVFQPYGMIKSNSIKIDHDNINIFKGYNMKYDPKYNKPNHDHLGDLIDKHLREVICWNGEGEGETNPRLYKTWLAWLHKLIVKGEKTNVCMVNYSKHFGGGKSLLTSGLLKWVFGDTIAQVNSAFTKLMKDTFTDYWDSNILTIFEEMPELSSSPQVKEAWDFMKSVITEAKMTARKFYTAPGQMDIHTNIIINTNNFYSIPQGLADRRAIVNRISNHRCGDVEYFNQLLKASDSYEGWENFIHRYLIKGYHKFSDINIQPNASCMVDTPYRRELMARGGDSLVYFFKEFMSILADPNDDINPYKRQIGKRIPISKLYIKYKDYKMKEGIEFNDCKDLNAFEKKLLEKFEIKIRNVNVKNKSAEVDDDFAGMAKVHQPVITKTRCGKCITIDEIFIKKITLTIKDKILNADEEEDIDEAEWFSTEYDLDKAFGNGFINDY